MKITRNLISALLLLVVFGAYGPTTVGAQAIEQLDVEERNDFVIGPGKTEIVVEPGDSEQRELRVTSRVLGTNTFRIEIEDFTGSDDSNKAVELLGDQEGPYSLRDFVELPFTEFTLNFGERITIPVTVNVPADIAPGGRYGAVIVSNVPDQPEGDTENAGTVVVARLGSLFLVRIAGDVVEDGQLSDFRITSDKKLFTSGHPEQMEILFRNNGSVHVVPYGMIDIKNIFGSVVDQIPVDAYFALPDATRTRVVEWTEAPTLFGYYKAELNLNRGYDDIEDTMSLSFWVLPWQPMLIGLLVILLLAFMITAFTRKFELKKK